MSVETSGNFASAPKEIILEVLDAGGSNLTYSDMGPEFCEDFGLEAGAIKKPFKVCLSKNLARVGVTHFTNIASSPSLCLMGFRRCCVSTDFLYLWASKPSPKQEAICNA